YEITFNAEGFAPTSYERTEATRSSEKELGYESSDWHLEGEQQAAQAAAQQAPAQQQAKNQNNKPQRRPQQAAQDVQQAQPAQVTPAAQASASPCAWLENLFVQKQAKTVDQARTANNAAAAIEQMVNGGAVSRGQFGQVATSAPVVSEPVETVNNNVYLTPSTPVAAKQEQREVADKYSDREEKAQRHNKKRTTKPKEQREQVQHDNQQNQVHEEIVQVPRHEQRQEARQEPRQETRHEPRQDQRPEPRQDQRDNKRPTRRQHVEQQPSETQPEQNAVPRRDRNSPQRPHRPTRHRDQGVLNEQAPAPQQAIAAPVVNEQQPKVEVIDTPRQEVIPTALVVNVDQAKSEIVALNAPAAVVEAPIAQTAPVAVAEIKAAVVEKPVAAKEEKPAATPETREPQQPRSADQRASNDPRMHRRQKREAQAKQAQAPKLNPSQVPTLGQYTVGSLIRHVYGEDCS